MTRRRRFVLTLAVLVGAAQCGTAGTPPPTHAFPVQEYTLPSGLKVVLEQDDVSTIAGIVVIVDVGHVDNPPGKAGIAHVLEHLVFRVPDETGASVQRRLARMGAAAFNAETGIERTTYHAFGPRQKLEDLVAVLLGRLADPLRGAKQTHVTKETSITAEELRKREGAAGYEFLMPALLAAGHPSGRAYSDLRRSDTVSLADLRGFADTFYRPERMTVVISGPMPPGWEKTLWARMPPSLHGQEAKRMAPIRRPVSAFDGPARAEAELPSHTAKVYVPELWMAWRVPPSVGIAAKNADVMAHVVQQVLSSRLDPDGTNDVLDVDGFAFPGSLSTVVGCRFKLRAAGDAVRIRNETKAALEALADVTLMHSKGRLWWGHLRALQSATLTTALGMETIQGRTFARADLAHSGSSALISGVLGALEKITVDDISDFAARYLKPEAARSVLVVPEERQTGRARYAQADRNDSIVVPGHEPGDTEEPEAKHPKETKNPNETQETKETTETKEIKPEEDDVPDKRKIPAITQAPGIRAALMRKLSNGLTVIAMRRPGLPFATVLLGFHADPQPGDAPGARVGFERTLHWNLSEGPLDRGLLFWRSLYVDSAQESLSMFSASSEKAFDFLSEEADSLHIFWPNPSFDRWVDETALTEGTPEYQSARVFRTALFGKHPYHLLPTAAEVRQVTERQIQAYFDRVRRPANGAVIVVGEIDPENVARAVERALKGWKGDPAPPPAPAASLAPSVAPQVPANVVVAGRRAKIIYTDDARRKSADVRFGCILPPVRTPRDEIVNDLLAIMLEDGVYGRLRWDLGVSYSTDVDASAARGGTAWFNGRLDIDSPALPKALDVLHTWLDEGTASPIDESRFERLRWNKARRSAIMNATGSQLARSIFSAWNLGWDPMVLDDYPRHLGSVTVNDLDSALKVCRKSAVISVLGPGPRQ